MTKSFFTDKMPGFDIKLSNLKGGFMKRFFKQTWAIFAFLAIATFIVLYFGVYNNNPNRFSWTPKYYWYEGEDDNYCEFCAFEAIVKSFTVEKIQGVTEEAKFIDADGWYYYVLPEFDKKNQAYGYGYRHQFLFTTSNDRNAEGKITGNISTKNNKPMYIIDPEMMKMNYCVTDNNHWQINFVEVQDKTLASATVNKYCKYLNFIILKNSINKETQEKIRAEFLAFVTKYETTRPFSLPLLIVAWSLNYYGLTLATASNSKAIVQFTIEPVSFWVERLKDMEAMPVTVQKKYLQQLVPALIATLILLLLAIRQIWALATNKAGKILEKKHQMQLAQISAKQQAEKMEQEKIQTEQDLLIRQQDQEKAVSLWIKSDLSAWQNGCCISGELKKSLLDAWEKFTKLANDPLETLKNKYYAGREFDQLYQQAQREAKNNEETRLALLARLETLLADNHALARFKSAEVEQLRSYRAELDQPNIKPKELRLISHNLEKIL